MYLGRIVAIGMNKNQELCAMYRVSSRSFPNREAVAFENRISIVPRKGFEDDLKRNPYISYNCLRVVGKTIIASNGSHTDPIAEKIAMNYPVRDAITLGLLAMDYEKDDFDTPRIVATVTAGENSGYLGIVRKDAILVKKFDLTPGKLYYISTYECNETSENYIDNSFDCQDANGAAQYVVDGGVFANFDNPVTSAVGIATQDGFKLATVVI